MSSISAGTGLQGDDHRLDCCSIAKLASHDEVISALRAQPSSHILVLDEAENCVGILGAQHLIKNARPARRLRKPLVILESPPRPSLGTDAARKCECGDRRR